MLSIMKRNAPDCSIEPALILFCRRPVIGVGKQRLAAELGAEVTAEVARQLLDAALEDAADWPGQVIIAPAEHGDTEWAETLTMRPVEVIAQPAGNLGARINAVDAAARSRGHRRLICIGSDSPVLSAQDYAAAREALADHDCVLIPAADGGVTLMGARVPWPNLADLRWSSQYLAAELERCCHDAGLTLSKLANGYDVDLTTDLARLRGDLANDTRPARQRLYQWLSEHRV